MLVLSNEKPQPRSAADNPGFKLGLRVTSVPLFFQIGIAQTCSMFIIGTMSQRLLIGGSRAHCDGLSDFSGCLDT